MASGVLLRAKVFVLLMVAIVTSGGRMSRASAQDSKQPLVGGPYLAAIVVPELEPSADWYQKHLGFQKQETVILPDLRITFLIPKCLRRQRGDQNQCLRKAQPASDGSHKPIVRLFWAADTYLGIATISSHSIATWVRREHSARDALRPGFSWTCKCPNWTASALFGGNKANDVSSSEKWSAGRLGDTWSWDGNRWHQLSADGPGPRDHHAMSYDKVTGAAILFGGFDGRYLDDTWKFTNHWQRLTTQEAPPARSGRPALFFDDARKRLTIFGGGTGAGTELPPRTFNDLWYLSSSGWEPGAICQ